MRRVGAARTPEATEPRGPKMRCSAERWPYLSVAGIRADAVRLSTGQWDALPDPLRPGQKDRHAATLTPITNHAASGERCRLGDRPQMRAITRRVMGARDDRHGRGGGFRFRRGCERLRGEDLMPARDELRARRVRTRRRPQVQTKAGASRRPRRTSVVRPKRASGGRRRRRPQSRAQAEALVTQAAAPYAAGGSAWPSLVVEPHDVAERDFDAPVAGNGPSGPSLVTTQTP
jgi:hypothetical protein